MVKNKIEIPKYLVFKDTREKPGHGWTFPEDELCLGTQSKRLKTGDYTIEGWENDFIIERKASTAEICQNIYEYRFEKELVRLREFKYAFIVCEFSFDDVCMFPINSGIPKSLWHKVQMSVDFMQNCLLKWQIQYGVKVIFAGKNGDIVAKKLFKYILKYGIKV